MYTKAWLRIILSFVLAVAFFPLSYASASQTIMANPSISLTNLTAGTDEVVVMPVTFNPGTYSISAIVFSIDFDQTLMSFDNSDVNMDGVPDSITFNVPASFSVSASYDPSDTDGEIDIVIADYSPPLAALSGGNIVNIEFTTGIINGIADVYFSADPPPSFGTTSGSGVTGSVTHGSVTIGTVASYKVYLPAIIKQVAVTTYSISGQVTHNSSPLSGVVVSTGGKTATSDASGNYTISNLSAGSYTLTATKSGYTCTASFSQPVAVPPSLSGKNFTCTSNVLYSISGTVRNEGGSGMNGVTVKLEGVMNTTTNSSGQYTFSGLTPGTYKVTPSYPGYVFTPISRSVVVGPDAANQDFTAADSLIENGGFEEYAAWIFPDTEYTGGYSTQQAHTGGRSARVGIIATGDNKYAYSSVYQIVDIPSSLSEVTLDCYLYTKSTEAKLQANVPIVQRGVRPDEAIKAYDLQYVMILDIYGNILATLWIGKSNTQAWAHHTFELSDYLNLSTIKGKSVSVYFGAYNDGYGGVTGMYVDDVSLRITP